MNSGLVLVDPVSVKFSEDIEMGFKQEILENNHEPQRMCA